MPLPTKVRDLPRNTIVGLALIGAHALVPAQPAAAALGDCAAIDGDRERLACFCL
ncbi:MAG: hypothetical protein J0L57_04055 [Burkholderiales bacterium]|nr:hypothetical protein [Burkholderiales bacterium]